jgi:hypothetical protein
MLLNNVWSPTSSGIGLCESRVRQRACALLPLQTQREPTAWPLSQHDPPMAMWQMHLWETLCKCILTQWMAPSHA